MRVLLVEDDPKLAAQVKSALYKFGYAVDIADNGVDGEFKGDEEPYELIILDLGLPQRAGLEVLKNWRNKGNKTPVLILTARNDWSERVDGLTMGADDYLGKPFYMQELVARINALIRRNHGEASTKLSLGGISLDKETQTATTADGTEHSLTHIEFRLLHYFMTHPGAVLSKNRLIEHVYEGDTEHDGNVIEVYVRRIRNKLGKNILQTRRHQGYVFPEDPV
ncbi:MAG: response regulator transcription factor [Cocleimonas sp.]|nr:response regulator transcription factor [Cocleimonas sp.]